MGRKCNVLDCPSDSKRQEDNGVTFHKMPFHPDLRPKWIELCRIPEERQINKIIYVCSRHFRRIDFCNFKGSKYMLRQGALPSVFPWTKSLIKPTQQSTKITIPNEEDPDNFEIKTEPIDEDLSSKSDDITEKADVETEPPEEPEEEKPSEKPKIKKETLTPTTVKKEVTTVKKEVSTAKKEVSTAKKEVSTAKKEVSTAKKEVSTAKKEVSTAKKEVSTAKKEVTTVKKEVTPIKKEVTPVKKEVTAVKKEPTAETSVIKPAASAEIKTEPINFLPGTRIEANDFNDKWNPATILEVDYDENEVFVEFDKHLNKANEWIPMDSSRLRPYQPPNHETYAVGEKVMAAWVKSNNKFPATIQKVLDAETYEVLFDDGFSKIIKHNKIFKIKDSCKGKRGSIQHSSPLFDPVVGSKEERRERKRKLNVAELFGIGKPTNKKNKGEDELEDDLQPQEEVRSSTSQCEGEEWTCRWLNGEPVGVESTLASTDGPRRSVIVADHRLPAGWEKHLQQRQSGNCTGKWDTIIVNPQGKRFSTLKSIRTWLEEHQLDYNLDQFDFCLHINRARKLGLYEVTDPNLTISKSASKKSFLKGVKDTPKSHSHKISTPKTGSAVNLPLTPETPKSEPIEEEEDTSGCLKIIHEDGSYKCPIEGCGKIFRKENLAQMHIKHYHPESAKLLGSTPNVADLAYARTVGEHIDDIVPKTRPIGSPLEKEKLIKPESTPKPKSSIKVLTPKIPTKTEETDTKKSERPSLGSPPKPAIKDSEIIRLLNSEPKSKTMDSIFETVTAKTNDVIHKHLNEESAAEPTTADKYPEIKLKDLLHKAEPIPIKKDEYRPSGIKTLLPVIRQPVEEVKQDQEDLELNLKSHAHVKVGDKLKPGRKRQSSDHSDPMKRTRQSVKYDADDISDFYGEDSRSQDSFKDKKPVDLLPIPPVTESPEVIIEGGEVIRLVHMRSEEIINCTCRITEEDGLMIQCELCLCWQHAHCNNIQRENEVPDKYVCYICRNPQNMRASKKYIHDQEWLKQGVLPTANFHSKNEEALKEKFEKLRKSHELSGCITELNEYIHNLRIKLSVADNKDHPKLYLWNKPWEKPTPVENLNAMLSKSDIKQNIKEENLNSSFSGSDHSYIKSSTFGDLALKSMLEPPEEIKLEEIKPEEKHIPIEEDTKINSESELLSILEDETPPKTEPKPEIEPTEFPKIDLNSIIANNLPEKIDLKDETKENNTLNSITSGILSSGSLELALSQEDLVSSFAQINEVEAANEVDPAVHIPEPEAVIDPADCRMNLIDHVNHFQALVNERLNYVEAEISELEDQDSNLGPDDDEDSFPKIKQALQMLLNDLTTMRYLASLSN